jgi:hypothetical protein
VHPDAVFASWAKPSPATTDLVRAECLPPQSKKTKEEQMTFLDQLKKIVRSRKFWVLAAALLATLAAFLTREISVWQALQAALAALAVYSTGVAIEDNGYGPQKQR